MWIITQYFPLLFLTLLTQPVPVQCFPSPCSCLGVFFFSFPESLDLFRVFLLYDQRTCTHTCTVDHLFFALVEFQTWNWLCYPLTCGHRGGVGMRNCAWSRNLYQNVFPGRSLNVIPLTWQSSTQPIDHRAPLIANTKK